MDAGRSQVARGLEAACGWPFLKPIHRPKPPTDDPQYWCYPQARPVELMLRNPHVLIRRGPYRALSPLTTAGSVTFPPSAGTNVASSMALPGLDVTPLRDPC